MLNHKISLFACVSGEDIGLHTLILSKPACGSMQIDAVPATCTNLLPIFAECTDSSQCQVGMSAPRNSKVLISQQALCLHTCRSITPCTSTSVPVLPRWVHNYTLDSVHALRTVYCVSPQNLCAVTKSKIYSTCAFKGGRWPLTRRLVVLKNACVETVQGVSSFCGFLDSGEDCSYNVECSSLTCDSVRSLPGLKCDCQGAPCILIAEAMAQFGLSWTAVFKDSRSWKFCYLRICVGM